LNVVLTMIIKIYRIKVMETLVPVYLLIEIKIIHRELYSKYIRKVHEVVTMHGGRYLVRGGKVTPLSGDWVPERIIVIEFETIEQLRKCFNSAEYLELAPLREQSTESRAIILEGCSPAG
jgi:uncharacterized protein (DUF1330 family)